MKKRFKGESSALLTMLDSLIENHYPRSYNDLKFSQFYIIESIRVRNRVSREDIIFTCGKFIHTSTCSLLFFARGSNVDIHIFGTV